jgi:hypothetical protein
VEGYRASYLQRRIPASFAVRFHPHGQPGRWLRGAGVDLSAGGLRFVCTAPAQPRVKLKYELKLTLTFPRRKRETLRVEAEVRWYKETGGGITVGLRVADPSHQQALARVVARLQASLGE